MCGVFTMIEVDNPDGSKWFYHNDHLGSTTLITDEDGNIVEETFYTPFGQNTAGGVEESYYLYTNQFKDAIGCYDYGARVYCPGWYHFTSADPIIASIFDPQGLNHYSYVKNNPYRYVDPDGKKIKSYGASKGYKSSGYWSSKYGGGDGGGGSSIAVYNVEYETDDGRKRKVSIDAEDYERWKDTAELYEQESVYAQHFSDDRDISEEIMVAYIEQTIYDQEYQPKSDKQLRNEDKLMQSITTVVLSVATAETGGLGGPIAALFYANADIQEIRAIGGEPTTFDMLLASADIASAGFAAKSVRISAKILGINLGRSITADFTAEGIGELIYQGGRSSTINYVRGDEDG